METALLTMVTVHMPMVTVHVTMVAGHDARLTRHPTVADNQITIRDGTPSSLARARRRRASAPRSHWADVRGRERMKQKEAYVRDTLVTVQQFLDANAAALGPVNTSGARKALDDAIAALDDHAVAQGAHTLRSAGETNKQRTLRLALRKQYLRPIAKVAAASLGNVPEISTLRMPPPNLA